MRIDILTLFPKMFENILGESIMKRAQAKGKLAVKVHDLRDWTSDAHKTADDKPFGGGPGMVMKVEPIYLALEQLGLIGSGGKGQGSSKNKTRVILLTPQGRPFQQKIARELTGFDRLVFICGHYEGIDERVRSLVDDEISIGDYILTCGEIPALVMVDAVTRLIPGVLGHSESTVLESFENSLLEYPHYTRPAEYQGMKVPDILLSGDHKKIETWRKDQALRRTKIRRPDLLKQKHRKEGSVC